MKTWPWVTDPSREKVAEDYGVSVGIVAIQDDGYYDEEDMDDGVEAVTMMEAEGSWKCLD